MATPGGYTVLVLNSILLIIVRREFNERKQQLQLEHLSCSDDLFASVSTF